MAEEKKATLGLILTHKVLFGLEDDSVELVYHEPNKKENKELESFAKKQETEVTKLFVEAKNGQKVPDVIKINSLRDSAQKKRFEMLIKDGEAKTKVVNFIDEYGFTYSQVNEMISTMVAKSYEKKLREYKPM